MTVPVRDIVEQAILAPSVHNIQPVRYMMDGDGLLMLRRVGSRLPVADPADHDVLISAGAALEGISLAASRLGLTIEFKDASDIQVPSKFVALGRVTFVDNGTIDPLAEHVATRSSWRGNFNKPTVADRNTASTLTSVDSFVLSSPDDMAKLAVLADQASLRFMSDEAFRQELVSWMRFTRSHPRWLLDGLNADAMNMNFLEASAASVLLGKPFTFLQKMGLAQALISETSRYKNAVGMMIVHRPYDENPLEKGRHFYRKWLSIVQAGFVANVVAALADDAETRNALHAMCSLPNDRQILTAFVFGRIPRNARPVKRARLSFDAFLLDNHTLD